MAKMNVKESLIGLTLQAKEFLTKDLKAIPADKQNTVFGGCSRSALNMVAECAGNCDVMSKILTGTSIETSSPEVRAVFFGSFDTQEKVLAFLDEKVASLVEVIKNLDEDTLGDDCPDFPFGKMNRFGIAQLPGVHMMYHDGQLNYIHTLLNDSAVHWTD